MKQSYDVGQRTIVRRFQLASVLTAVVLAKSAAVFAMSPVPPGASDRVVLDGTTSTVNLATRVAVLEDCTGSLTLDDVATGKASAGFRRGATRSLSFGYTTCAFWLRLDVVGRAEALNDWLLVVENPRVDHADLYRDGGVESAGNLVPLSRRPLSSRYPVFNLGHLPVDASRIFLRLQTSDVAAYPLFLMQPGALVDATAREHLLLGLYFGIMLVAAFLSAVVFVGLRDRAYLLYALFLFNYALFEATVKGMDIAYLWPEHPFWNMPAIPISCGLTILCGAAFSARFLMLRQYAPTLKHLANGVLVAGAGMAVVAAAGAHTVAGIIGSVLAPVSVVIFGISGVVAMVRGCPQAKYFLLAGTLQFLGVVLNAFRNFGLVPATFVPTYGGQIGSTLFVLLVSIALMARFEILRREKERAQEDALESRHAAADAKRVTAELRLQALQARINPHFLFNTLNTIAGLIAEAPSRAQCVVLRLSRLFRYTLVATEKDRVLLTEELAIVRAYLEIEQERFGERLGFAIEVDGEIEGVSLPGLTIQPLVENAVKHGLRPKVEGGKLTVRVRVVAGAVWITVEDDGMGMDPTAVTEGHGLNSVRERLRLAYGGAASMTLTSPPGVRVEIRLPAR